jgi:O-antigen/teichoic acid export membrane protein
VGIDPAPSKARLMGYVLVFVRFAVSGLLILAFQIGTMPIFSPAEIGTIAILLAVSNLLTVVSDLGVGPASIQRNSQLTQREVGNTLTLSLAITLLLGVTLLLVGGGKGLFAMLTCLLLLMPVLAVRAMAIAEADRRIDFKIGASLEMLEAGVLFLGTLALGVYGFGPWSFIIASVVRALVGWLWMLRSRAWNLSLNWKQWRQSRPLWNFGLSYHSGAMLNTFRILAGPVLLAGLGGLAEVGLVDRAIFIASAPLLFFGLALNRILFPLFSKSDFSHQRLLFERSLWASALMDKCAFIVIFMLTRPLCDRFLPASYEQLPKLVQLVALPGLVLGSFSCLVWPLLAARGLTGSIIQLNFISAAISWFTMPPLIWYFGMWGAIFGNILVWFATFLPYLIVRRQLPGVTILRPLMMTTLACAIVLIPGMLWKPAAAPDLIGVILITMATLVAYILVAWLLCYTERRQCFWFIYLLNRSRHV